jgi:hypothetical protein
MDSLTKDNHLFNKQEVIEYLQNLYSELNYSENDKMKFKLNDLDELEDGFYLINENGIKYLGE